MMGGGGRSVSSQLSLARDSPPSLSASGNLRERSTLQFALQSLALPTWIKKGGRNDSGNEPIRLKRSMLGSSDRRMWALSAAIAARLSRASKKS